MKSLTKMVESFHDLASEAGTSNHQHPTAPTLSALQSNFLHQSRQTRLRIIMSPGSAQLALDNAYRRLHDLVERFGPLNRGKG
jgi:hypothetical protein